MTFEEDYDRYCESDGNIDDIKELVEKWYVAKQKVRDAIMKWSHKDSSKGEALTGIVHDLEI